MILVLMASMTWVGCATAAVGPPRLDAREIIRRSLKAVYGKDEVPSKKNWHFKFTGAFHKGKDWGTFESEAWDAANGSYYSKTLLKSRTGSITRILVITPKQGWELSGTKRVSFNKSAYDRHVEKVYSLYPLLDDNSLRLTVLGEGKVSIPYVHASARSFLFSSLFSTSIKTISVRVSSPWKPEVILHFDKKTWLIVKVDITVTAFFVLRMSESRFFWDYKTIDGRKMPMKEIRIEPGQWRQYTISEFRSVDRIDEKLFRKPW
jgi:hypothetical protein